MQHLTQEQFVDLLADHQAPCISVYQPTTRLNYPGGNENPIRFQNLLKQVEEELAGHCSPPEAKNLLQKLRSAVPDEQFWATPMDSVAYFCSPDVLKVISLPRTVPEQFTIGRTFHTKPLIRLLQTADRYQVLCLAQGQVRLFEGNRDGLDEIELKHVPRSVLESRDTAQEGIPVAPRTSAASGATPGAPGHPSAGGFGHQTRLGGDGTPVEPFAREVDQAIWEHYSRTSGLPLILCAVQEYHPIFQKISKNQNLMKEGIRLDPQHLPLERLRDEAWKVMEPYFQERTDRIINNFRAAQAHQKASADLPDVTHAVAFGKVGTLLVDADQQIPGHIDLGNGTMQLDRSGDAGAEDILDELAETVLKRDGQVLVLPHDQMPTQTGVAAIYRF